MLITVSHFASLSQVAAQDKVNSGNLEGAPQIPSFNPI